MTERERLIELLMQGELEADRRGVLLCSQSKWKAEIMTDFLLENGVIVPPVKFGDTVYKITECYMPPCFSTDDNFAVKHYICTTTFKRSDIYPKNLYFTREEAEKALAEKDSE